MAVLSQLPPPVVTITDPHHPAPLLEPHDSARLGVPPHRRLRRVERIERIIATLLALLLLACLNAAAQLREEQRQERQLATLRLAAALVAGEALSSYTGVDLSVELIVRADNETDIQPRSVAVDKGWTVTGTLPDTLVHGSATSVTIQHPIDCVDPVTPPSKAVLDAVAGSQERHLVIPVAGSVPDVKPYCGEMHATDAIRLSASSITDHGDGSVVVLSLVNASTRPVSFMRLRFGGFGFRTHTSLPLRLEPRSRGVLVKRNLVDHPVTFDVAVVDCRAAEASLERAASSANPDVVEFAVGGAGGPGVVGLEIPGIEAYLAADRQADCG